jgi:hypothetical protein
VLLGILHISRYLYWRRIWHIYGMADLPLRDILLR